MNDTVEDETMSSVTMPDIEVGELRSVPELHEQVPPVPGSLLTMSPVDRSPIAPQSRRGRIPRDVMFTGSISGTDDFEVEGVVKGTIELIDSDLMVLEGADVNGTIAAKNAVISGNMGGEIRCETGCVTFTPTARCEVSLQYGELVVERGAKVNAQLRSTGE